MVKIRITGTEDEVAEVVEDMKEYYRCLEISAWYKNRGQSEYGRVYIDIELDDR
jgi:hypothetical protein